jgi:site-specific recombinase XerD
MTSLAPTLQAYFTTRLTSQYGASPHTVAAYRDTWCLLLGYAAKMTATAPTALDLSQIDAELINGFLTDLEAQRGNGIATRNARLAALHSFFSYASRYHPEQLATIGRVLAIPPKRRPRTEICYLTDTEIAALLAAPDQTTKAGRRDHAMFQLAVTAGLRVSELTGLKIGDVHLGAGPHVLCRGKGRKNRTTPLDRQTVHVLRNYTTQRASGSEGFMFPTRTGTQMSRDAVAARLALHITTAAASCPSLNTKTVTPHALRHSAAMRLLTAGIDATVIALWLGHESIETTLIYLHADMTMKENALARTTPTGTQPGRYKPVDDDLLAFLRGL